MAESIDARETGKFFLNVPQKLDDPFPDLAYFRENRPVFYHEALDQWFVFRHEDVSKLFSEPRMSAGRMKGFVDAAPEEVREDLREVIPRIALEEVELRGASIRAGQIVQLSIASANRDPSHFPDPDRFDITKERGPTLSFGHGPHGCLGALLAMEEARISLETLFRRMPNLRLDETREIRWYRNAANRGPDSLPLVF